nr:amidase domain-containing protein [uncultured Anaerostipes sp.]
MKHKCWHIKQIFSIVLILMFCIGILGTAKVKGKTLDKSDKIMVKKVIAKYFDDYYQSFVTYKLSENMADYMIDNDNTFLYKKLYEYDILSSKNIGTGYEDYKLDLKYSGMDINEAKTYGPKGKGYNNNKLAKSLTNIQVGDVLQSRRDGKKNVYKHSTYVTQIKDRQTFVTQHNLKSRAVTDWIRANGGVNHCYIRGIRFSNAKFVK